jgi:AcrR family transcriptional regulator
VDAKTQKSEMTRTAIIGAGMDLASAEGLESITLQAVADRIGMSKSGVFSRIGSRETLQKAVIEEYGRRFMADVFVPAMQQPKGLPRLDSIVQRWIVRTRDVEANRAVSTPRAPSSWTTAKALRETLLGQVTKWRAALRRTVLQAVEAGHLQADTDPEQLVAEIYALSMGCCTTRFLRDTARPNGPRPSWKRLLKSYQAEA